MQKNLNVFDHPCRTCGEKMEVVRTLIDDYDIVKANFHMASLMKCKNMHYEVREIYIDGENAVLTSDIYSKKEWEETKGPIIITPKCTKCKTRMKYKEPYMCEQHIDISSNGNSYADYKGFFYCPVCFERIEFDGRCPEEVIYKMIQLTNYLDIFEMVEEGKMVKLRDVLKVMDDSLKIKIITTGSKEVNCSPISAFEFLKDSMLDRNVVKFNFNVIYLGNGESEK